MIRKLCLRNFRAFDKLEINLAKINIFVGPNNSGKSALLSSLNLLSQTIQSRDYDLPLLFNGPIHNFGTYYDTVFNNDLRRNIEIGFSFDKPFVGFKKLDPFSVRFSFKYRQRLKKLYLWATEYRRLQKLLLRAKIAKKSDRLLTDTLFGRKQTGKRLYIDKYFAVWNFLLNPRHDIEKYLNYSEQGYLRDIGREIRVTLNNIEYLGPFRVEPERYPRYSGERPSTIGPHGEFANDLLLNSYMEKKGGKKNLLKLLGSHLKKMGIAERISINELSEMIFKIVIKHPITKENVNIADTGYGCSQVLPMLLSGLISGRRSILIFEQPELHLHPKAQSEFGDFIYSIKDSLHQLFIETHSEHLLLRLQTHVAKGNIAKEDIKVHYVYSSSEGKKKVKELPLGDDGLYIEEWPEGFFPERYQEARKLAKASRR